MVENKRVTASYCKKAQVQQVQQVCCMVTKDNTARVALTSEMGSSGLHPWASSLSNTNL